MDVTCRKGTTHVANLSESFLAPLHFTACSLACAGCATGRAEPCLEGEGPLSFSLGMELWWWMVTWEKWGSSIPQQPGEKVQATPPVKQH